MDDMILLENITPYNPANRQVVVIPGRFNPPTIGHYELVDRAKKFITEHSDIDTKPVILLIQGKESSKDKRKNPLTAAERERAMKLSGRCHHCTFVVAEDVMSGFSKLRDLGMEPVAVVSGNDRSDYLKLLQKYMKLDDKGEPIKRYDVKPLTRDEGAGLEPHQVSATMARAAAVRGDLQEFARITGLKREQAQKLIQKIKDRAE